MNQEVIKVIDWVFTDQTTVYLQQSGITDAEFQYVLTKDTQNVFYLDLWQNSLTSLSIMNMKPANWSRLAILQLGQNYISDKGCKFLSQVNLQNLTHLKISDNEISSVGLSHIAKAIWKHLSQISLSYNKIAVDGIKQIGRARWSQGINIIDLIWNVLSIGELVRIFLLDNSSITSIQFQHNKAFLHGFFSSEKMVNFYKAQQP